MGDIRNFDNIQFEMLRRKLDWAFNETHDELEIAYYKNWKLGISRPFHNYDKQNTVEASKGLFDKLHGALWTLYTVAFDVMNKLEPLGTKIPEDKYRLINGVDHVEEAIVLLSNFALDFRSIKQELENKLKISIISDIIVAPRVIS